MHVFASYNRYYHCTYCIASPCTFTCVCFIAGITVMYLPPLKYPSLKSPPPPRKGGIVTLAQKAQEILGTESANENFYMCPRRQS